MPVYNQGEDYEEDEVQPTPSPAPRPRATPRQAPPPQEEEPVVEEEPQGQAKGGKFHLSSKMIACGVALIALIILIVFLAAWFTSSNNKKAEAKRQEEALALAQAQEEYYQQHPEDRPTVASVEGETTDPAPVQTAPTSTTYSSKELSALRKWGYTASELEIASRDGITAEGLVKSARRDREAAQKEALMAVMDTASPEYQNLLNKTWLGGDSIDLSSVNPEAVYNTATRTENVDFEKCGAQGTQLFLKLYLDNGTCAFMTVSPRRWVTLPDSGNIVVSISQVEYTDVTVITSIKEVSIE